MIMWSSYEFFVPNMLKVIRTKRLIWDLGVEKDLLFLIQFQYCTKLKRTITCDILDLKHASCMLSFNCLLFPICIKQCSRKLYLNSIYY
jgi:hypothetical protein